MPFETDTDVNQSLQNFGYTHMKKLLHPEVSAQWTEILWANMFKTKKKKMQTQRQLNKHIAKQSEDIQIIQKKRY